VGGGVAPDFWRSSGWHLVERDAHGRHLVTPDLLRAYLARPELRPPPGSCEAERALHAMLLDEPERPVTPVHLVALADPDARENWQVFIAFRDRLLRAPALEDAYLALARGDAPPLPPLLLDQLAHLILRGVLDGCGDGLRLRAAECLFRPQRVAIEEGRVLLADEETVEARGAAPGGMVELDLLGEENAALYFARSDRFDTVLEVTFTRPGLDALCRVFEAWVRHFHGIEVMIQPVRAVRDERWAWHTGLDAAASAILNELWLGRDPGEARLADMLALFRLEFRDPVVVRPDLAGRPVYLGMARNAQGRLRLKPQNLLLNLPLASAEASGGRPSAALA
jgi:hypothetical protein